MHFSLLIKVSFTLWLEGKSEHLGKLPCFSARRKKGLWRDVRARAACHQERMVLFNPCRLTYVPGLHPVIRHIPGLPVKMNLNAAAKLHHLLEQPCSSVPRGSAGRVAHHGQLLTKTFGYKPWGLVTDKLMLGFDGKDGRDLPPRPCPWACTEHSSSSHTSNRRLQDQGVELSCDGLF